MQNQYRNSYNRQQPEQTTPPRRRRRRTTWITRYLTSPTIPKAIRNLPALLGICVTGCVLVVSTVVGIATAPERDISEVRKPPSTTQHESAPSEDNNNMLINDENPQDELPMDSQSEDDSCYLDTFATATRFDPLTGEQLQAILDDRTKSEPSADTSSKAESSASSGASSASSGTASAASGSASSKTSSDATSSSGDAKPSNGKFDPNTLGTPGIGGVQSMKAKNSDTVGWLTIPNTNVSHAVLKGPDLLYYEKRGYDKQPSHNGVVWTNPDTKVGSSGNISNNTVLYGHNWTNYARPIRFGNANDVMFAQVAQYDSLDFAKQSPYIHYSTESEEMLFQVFAVFYTYTDFKYNVSDPGSGAMQNIIDTAKSKSKFDFKVDVNSSDKILTLSTCTRVLGPSSKQRFVVMGRLLRDGESPEESKAVAK